MDGRRKALLLISHDGVDPRKIMDALDCRSPQILKDFDQEAPVPAMSPADAAELGRRRRGVEPLRIVIMPQRGMPVAEPRYIEPMPVMIG